MRKITTAILLIVATTYNVFARATQESCNNVEEEPGFSNCTGHGCYWDISSGVCTPCAAGTYNGSGESQTKCLECGKEPAFLTRIDKLPVSQWKYATLIGANGPEECAVNITCPAGTGVYYKGTEVTCEKCWDKYYCYTSEEGSEETCHDDYYNPSEVTTLIENWQNTYEDEDNYVGCVVCPANSSPTDDTRTSCTCAPGYHVPKDFITELSGPLVAERTVTNTKVTACEKNSYNIIICKDCTNGTCGNYYNLKLEHGSQIQYINAPGMMIDTKPGYHHYDDPINQNYEYYLRSDDNKTIVTLQAMYFKPEDNNKNEQDVLAPPLADTYEYCPNWKINTFKVSYETSDENQGTITGPTSQQVCTYGQDCQTKGMYTATPKSGYVHIGWKCDRQAENGYADCADGIFTNGNYIEINGTKYLKPDANIKNATLIHDETIMLTAQWQKCPAGYYGCTADNLTGKPCPAGSTSNAGATDITGCFITSATQFCDKDGTSCFELNICTQNDDGTWKDCPGRNNTQTTN